MNINTSGKWCLPVAVANVINMDIKTFITRIGHNGMTYPYPFPNEDEPRGFHTQECTDELMSLGYASTPIEFNPSIIPFKGGPVHCLYEHPMSQFLHSLSMSDGFICGKFKDRGHAVTNFKGLIIDPRYRDHNINYQSTEFAINDFIPHVYFRVDKCT